MKLTTTTALRANAVLLCLSTCVAIIPSLTLSVLFGLFDDNPPSLPYHGATIALALLVMFSLRWGARRAFDAALAAHQVRLLDEPADQASIDAYCARAWLVQLHVELQGRHCTD
ncbi:MULTISPECIES: hypothetical protein [Paraburkholderia]|uniref:hypothetical protein n=1 Tax=Paraburkholderia TaxID=1822464 RepID=UPI001B2BECCC|nr:MULTISPECIES: hypothetical protein [Paraburkholderia]MCP2088601.1 hypothetical protein [Paraburkholderia sediminicola]MCX4158347.1 hypothetical protein [Paraburkholderia aspalathi]MDN7167748.1 hypothetical protein [Paraburkholderia sp. SECH2]MDQ6396236.1 hypothetical protein [Paraburkholderia aspalathi]CAE6803780.1 hypothetical protein R75465_05066 [Paraburkholderia aspalathi]